MFIYYLNVTMADKKIEISEEMLKAIIYACKEAESTVNSIRNGRKFEVQTRIDNYTISLKLESQTEVIPTRSISSITRAILKSKYRFLFENHFYKGSILNATLANQEIPLVQTPDDYQIVQEIVQLFFGQKDLNNWQRKAANIACNQIRDTITNYLNNK